jgi:hypothetical protein
MWSIAAVCYENKWRGCSFDKKEKYRICTCGIEDRTDVAGCSDFVFIRALAQKVRDHGAWVVCSAGLYTISVRKSIYGSTGTVPSFLERA